MKNMLNKIMVCFIILVIILNIAACSNSNDKKTNSNNTTMSVLNNNINKDKEASIGVGDTISFGREPIEYGVTSEPLSWVVLDKVDDKLLLYSKKVYEFPSKIFPETMTSQNETISDRLYELTGTGSPNKDNFDVYADISMQYRDSKNQYEYKKFYEKFFNNDEKNAICETNIETSYLLNNFDKTEPIYTYIKKSNYNTKVFILSKEEIQKYLNGNVKVKTDESIEGLSKYFYYVPRDEEINNYWGDGLCSWQELEYYDAKNGKIITDIDKLYEYAERGHKVFRPAIWVSATAISDIKSEEKLDNKNKSYFIKFVSSDFSNYPKVKLYYKIYDKNGVVVNDYVIKKVYLYEKNAGGEYLLREVKKNELLSENSGLNTSVVVDRSTSIGKSNLKKMKNVLIQFFDNMNFSIGDMAELISFGSDIKNVVKYTNDKNNLNTGVNDIVLKGLTKLYDALYRGITHASNQKGTSCVIGFTDGKDNKSSRTDNDVVEYSLSKQVPVYIVGAGKDIDEEKLRQIADKTGGKYWNINDLSELYEILKEIYIEGKNIYYFEYITDIPSDKERTIKLVIDDGSEIIETEDIIVPIVRGDIDKNEELKEDLDDSIEEKAPGLNSWYRTNDGYWYYFADDINTPKKGWFEDPTDKQTYYLDDVTGVMKVGWHTIGGYQYYFNESHDNEPNWYEVGDGFYESYGKTIKAYGSMFRDEETPDGRRVDVDGKLINDKQGIKDDDGSVNDNLKNENLDDFVSNIKNNYKNIGKSAGYQFFDIDGDGNKELITYGRVDFNDLLSEGDYREKFKLVCLPFIDRIYKIDNNRLVSYEIFNGLYGTEKNGNELNIVFSLGDEKIVLYNVVNEKIDNITTYDCKSKKSKKVDLDDMINDNYYLEYDTEYYNETVGSSINAKAEYNDIFSRIRHVNANAGLYVNFDKYEDKNITKKHTYKERGQRRQKKISRNGEEINENDDSANHNISLKITDINFTDEFINVDAILEDKNDATEYVEYVTGYNGGAKTTYYYCMDNDKELSTKKDMIGSNLGVSYTQALVDLECKYNQELHFEVPFISLDRPIKNHCKISYCGYDVEFDIFQTE